MKGKKGEARLGQQWKILSTKTGILIAMTSKGKNTIACCRCWLKQRFSVKMVLENKTITSVIFTAVNTTDKLGMNYLESSWHALLLVYIISHSAVELLFLVSPASVPSTPPCFQWHHHISLYSDNLFIWKWCLDGTLCNCRQWLAKLIVRNEGKTYNGHWFFFVVVLLLWLLCAKYYTDK